MVTSEIHGDIAVVSLSRPPVNAINLELINSLREELKRHTGDKSVRGVVLTGRDGCFSAGLDISELFPKDRDYIKSFWGNFSSLLLDLFSFSKPLYSAIGGHCPAGGTVMVIMTDYRVMADGSYIIGLNEIDVGLTVPYGIGSVFQYVVGNRNAEDLLLKAKLVPPSDALEYGLVNEICSKEKLVETTLDRISEASALYSNQQTLTKKILREPHLDVFRANLDRDTDIILDSWFSDSGQARLGTLYNRLTQKS